MQDVADGEVICNVMIIPHLLSAANLVLPICLSGAVNSIQLCVALCSISSIHVTTLHSAKFAKATPDKGQTVIATIWH